MQDSVQFRFVAFNSRTAGRIVKECERNIVERYSTTITNYPADDFALPRGCFMIAVTNNVTVGCGGFRRLNENTAELKRIYVKPEFRKRGIAQQIITSLEKRAKKLNYKEIWLETAKMPINASKLYKKLGYHIIPAFGEYVELKDSWCFAKSLYG